MYLNLYNLDFLLEWGDKPVDLAARKKWGSLERSLKVRNLFEKQTGRMMCQIIWVTILTAIVIACGFILAKQGKIKCAPDGSRWRYSSPKFGFLFLTFILFVCYQATAVLRFVFVKFVENRGITGELKGYLFGDLCLSFCNKEDFESDDSEIESNQKER